MVLKAKLQESLNWFRSWPFLKCNPQCLKFTDSARGLCLPDPVDDRSSKFIWPNSSQVQHCRLVARVSSELSFTVSLQEVKVGVGVGFWRNSACLINQNILEYPPLRSKITIEHMSKETLTDDDVQNSSGEPQRLFNCLRYPRVCKAVTVWNFFQLKHMI